MKRTFISLLLAAAFGMSSVAAMAQAEGRLRFGVISDTHFGENRGVGAVEKNSMTLKNLTAMGALDALAVAGDMTNNGYDSQFEEFVSVYNNPDNYVNPVGQYLLMMGNHDNYQGSALGAYSRMFSVFNGGENYPTHTYRTIKGYPFITVSMLASGNVDGYPASTQNWLAEQMEKAATECPGKPIFVFTHVAPLHTCYSSWAEFEHGISWAGDALNAILNNYPQAIVFAGHSHYPLGDPRSIHQGANPNSARQNYYTVVNTGSVAYNEIEGVIPPSSENAIEGLIVEELENGNIEIRRYDTFHNEEIGANNRWVVEAPFDGSKFRYASIYDADDNPNGKTLVDGLPAPAFADGAQLEVVPNAYGTTLRIPQASDNDCVVGYNVKLILTEKEFVIKQTMVYSRYFLNSAMPAVVEEYFDNLTPSTEYSFKVQAFDSFGNTSEELTATFETTDDDDPDSELPEPLGQWKFNDSSYMLLGENGESSMQSVLIDGMSLTNIDPDQSGMEWVDGPSAENMAVRIPKNVGLRINLFEEADLTNYTLQIDLRKPELDNGYSAILQTNFGNTDDADFCVHNGEIGIAAIGYANVIKANTWHRLILINDNGEFSFLVDGVPLNSGSNERFTISKDGFLLFTDEDGELGVFDVAEIAFWNTPLNEKQMRRIGRTIKLGDYLDVRTGTVSLLDETDFSININTSVPFAFELPDWIEGIDTEAVAGEKNYTFRTQSMDGEGRRTGTIIVKGEGMEPQEVIISQEFTGEQLPDPLGVWTFNDPNDIFACTGTAVLEPMMHTMDGMQLTTFDEGGFLYIEGAPNASSNAISVPAGSSLRLTSNAGNIPLENYTIMMDIRPESLSGWNGLYQNTADEKQDASLFLRRAQIGKGVMDYHGTLQEGVWMRVVWTVRQNYLTIYVDGKKIAESKSPHADIWALHPISYLLSDDDGEEILTEVAEIRFWGVPLDESRVAELGVIDQGEIVADPLPEASSIFTFDNPNDLLASTGEDQIVAASRGEGGYPIETSDLASIGLVPAEGPSATNGALTVPIDSYLRFYYNARGEQLENYTVMMDVRPKKLEGYQAILQAASANNVDAGLCFNNNRVGSGQSGLGYGGDLQEGQWYRIVWVVRDGYLTLYIDGEFINGSSDANHGRWALRKGSMFFADDDQEEGVIDIAELRFWEEPLTATWVAELGKIDDETGIQGIEASKAAVNGIFDLTGRRVDGSHLQKGVYISNGQKVLIP